jgi:hypothetical protein
MELLIFLLLALVHQGIRRRPATPGASLSLIVLIVSKVPREAVLIGGSGQCVVG